MIKKTSAFVVAVAATGALLLSACGTTGNPTTTPSGSTGTANCDVEIAFLGPQTGDYANLGLNESRGAELALDEFKKANSGCSPTFTKSDSQGNPEAATPLASQLVNNPKVIGVVGPAFSGETAATGETFAEAKLPTVTPSATNPKLSTNGWDTFHRILGNDDTQAPAAAKLMTGTLGAKKIFIVDDASEYGKGLADGIKKALASAYDTKNTDTVQQKQTDFSGTVTKVKASGADVLYYAGYYAEAGLLVKQLRAAGWDGKFLSGDGSLDKGFLSAAGSSASEGVVLTCPCAPAPDDFATKYKALTGEDPGTYSTEAYDAMNVFLQGIKAGNSTREAMLTWINGYDAKGITKQVKFDQTGEVVGGTVYAYTVTDGKLNVAEPIQ